MIRSARRLAVALLASMPVVSGQPGQVTVTVPHGVPLHVVSTDFGNSEFEARGGALVIELAGSVRFRHEGHNAVRAVTLAIRADERIMGGTAAVSVPSLHVTRGNEFTVYCNLRMLRPLPLPPGPVVDIVADSVLLDTLVAVGPDRLGSVQEMRVRELEARRDREFFLSRWRSGGREELATAMQASLRRQAAQPRLGIHPALAGAATAGRPGTGREVQFAFVQDPDAPIILERGTALVSGSISDAPRITLRNREPQGVRTFEIGWLVHDRDGVTYSVGSVPVGTDTRLAVGQRLETAAPGHFELLLADPGHDVEIEAMTAYVRSVELEDESLWVPTRSALEESRLLEIVPVSAEEQRLSELYRLRGPAIVVEELEKLAGENIGSYTN